MSLDESILFKEPGPSTWAHVILPLALPVVYTYSVPPHFVEQSKPGCRVEVIFGKSKKYAGLIRDIIKTEPAFPTKPILNVLDDTPLVYPQQLELWKWLSEYYMCTEGEVMAAALPAHFKLSSETILVYNEDAGEDFTHLTDDEFVVAEALLVKKQLQLSEVQQILDSLRVYPIIKSLLDKGVCFAWEKMNERYVSKKEKYVHLNPAFNNEESLSKLLNDWKGAPKQMELLLSFLHLQKTEGEVTQPALLKKSGASAAQLNALAAKEIVVIERRSVDRLPTLPKNVQIDFTLSDMQEDVLQQVRYVFDEEKVCLLHGATGSGKTLIYIRLIEEYFQKGSQVLYLLPEIALTTQVIRRLQKHFGGNIAIYHSRFNNQERIELWNKVRTGEIRIVLGARSSLFLPFRNLGLMIVDEEHDSSYKQQDPAPRYNARDAAIYNASLFNARVLLGSATPSLESYHNAKSGKYKLVEMPDRFGGLELPTMEIINLAMEPKKGKVMLSEKLQVSIQEELDKDRQVILFQNRRGYNPYLICGSCGYIPQCTHCDVSLTLHKYSNKMHCHYCGSTYPKISSCIACGSNNWMEKNFGTEKIEEQLEEIFQKYRIARMDVDSVKGKTAHDSLVQLFEQHRLDILVGTQMVVKGLDFDKVSLVGILDADGLLSFADFRVNERAFQLMEQVSGRAGRKEQQGKVLIQALNIKHPVLKYVQKHDYIGFYHWEDSNRKEFFYPPYSRLIQLTLRHKSKDVVEAAADKLAGTLRSDLHEFVTGPAAPVVGRIRNQYIMEIMLKLPRQVGKGINFKKIIRNHINLFHGEAAFKSVHIVIDVDPN